MTTYCLDPSMPFKAVYNLNMGTMPTDNVVFSHLTADITSADTTLAVTVGEGTLFKQGEIATIEQLNPNGKVTAREVVLIVDIEDDELTIVRATEQCVIDDTASPKVLDNIPLDFTAGAKISVYVSRALLNGVQVRLSQVNCPCNTCVYNQEMAITACIANNCDNWRDALYKEKARLRCNDCGFGDGSLGDCVITQNTFLNANCDYNFKNLTICSGVLVRFTGAGIPRINVQRKFCNLGTIDLRGGTFVGACSKCDGITKCTVSNNACQTCYTAMCWGCGGSGGGGYGSGTSGANASGNSGGAGGNGGCGYQGHYCRCGSYGTVEQGNCGCPADGCNGGNGGKGYGPASGECDCGTIIGYDGGGGGGGGGAPYGNGGDGGNAGAAGWYGCFRGCGGNGGNSGIWGTGGKGGDGGNWTGNCNNWFISGNGGNGGNGYIGGNGGRNAASNYHGSGNAGHGGKGIICGGQGADRIEHDYMINGCSRAGNGGMAINNMYGLIIHACEYYNYCIMAKGGDGGRGGDAPSGQWSSSGSRGNTGGCGGCGANGANGGHVSVAYIKLLQGGSVNISKGLGGRGGYNNCAYGCTTQNPGGANGSDGRYKICKPF